MPQGKAPEARQPSVRGAIKSSGLHLTAPVEVLVRRGFGELATVLLHEMVLVRLVLGLDVAHPESAGSN